MRKNRFGTITVLIIMLITSFSYANIIDELLEEAIKKDYKLKSLIYQEKAKEQKIEQEKSKYKPQIFFSSYLGWQEYKPYYTDTTKQTLQYYYLVFRQPVINLEVLPRVEISKIERDIISIKKNKEFQHRLYIFFTSLLDFAYTKEKIKILQKTKNLLEEKYKLATKLYLKKKLDKFKLSQIENEYISSLIALKSAKIEHKYHKKNLFSIIKSEERDIDLKINKDIKIEKDILEYSFWQKKLQFNFDLQEAKKQYTIAEQEIKKRKYKSLPKIDLEMSYMYSSTSAISIAKEDKRVALIFTMPIYQGGFDKAYIKEAIEMKKATKMDILQLKEDKEIELQEAWYTLHLSGNLIPEYQNQFRLLYDIKENTQKAFRKKIKTKMDLIKDEVNLLNSELKLLDKIYNFASSYIKLLYITGNLSNDKLSSIKSFFVIKR